METATLCFSEHTIEAHSLSYTRSCVLNKDGEETCDLKENAYPDMQIRA
jgi:hypothetical protein